MKPRDQKKSPKPSKPPIYFNHQVRIMILHQPSPVASCFVSKHRIKWPSVLCWTPGEGTSDVCSTKSVCSATSSSGSYRQTFNCPKMHHCLSVAASLKMSSLSLSIDVFAYGVGGSGKTQCIWYADNEFAMWISALHFLTACVKVKAH